ncbi:hypothetical protein BOTNAR_0549g00050 [Botryotinia narcissicola]|uniref:Uncharacterized protein n=1 Tax=Botryotinia narcissicola TaxID=278944 RepID=A0A4Z1HPX7_9HELO|nr:hypothetical protein BOTNAR_0549g00050 [Botryotinia narcissicola]
MEQSPSTSQRQPSSHFTNTNDKDSSGPSRSDVSTTTNEKTTSLKGPRPWNYYSDLSGDDDYDDDRPNLRSKSTNIVSSLRTSSPQQSTSRKRKAPNGIEALLKLIIHVSCIAAGALSSKFQSLKTKIELLEMQYPDGLPYTITFSRNTQTLYLECQECKKSLDLLKGGGNIVSHSSGVLHSTCVDERLRELEAEGFRRQLTKEVMAREKTMHSPPAFTTITRSQRLCRQKQTSRQQCPELAPSENFESTSSSEAEPIRLKRRLTLASSPTKSPANVSHPELDTSDEMLTRYQGFEKRLEDVVININIRQSAQHRLLIDEVQKKISYGLVPIDDRLTALENGRLEDEMKGVKKEVNALAEKFSQSQPDTDRIATLQEEINTLTAKVCNLAGLVENHELPASHSSTANDAALIEDLKKSKGTMMKRLATSEERLATLEEQNDRLVSKIKELERR